MKRFQVKIVGVTPYMQHRMDDQKLEQWEATHSLVITHDSVAKEDSVRAEYHCYRNADGSCYLPAEHIRGALIEAAKTVKGKVGAATKSMKSTVAGMFFVEDADRNNIVIGNYDAIDKRSAVNRAIKGRVMVVRPKWTTWQAEFILQVDNDTLATDMVKQILTMAGSSVGVGSFRPTNNGMFGRFTVETCTQM